MEFSYYMPARLLIGKGQINHLHEYLPNGRKALIVISSGKSMRANGYLEKVGEELEKGNVKWCVFDKISPNPTVAEITEGASIAKKESCDFVVGLGGGSSMDSAKAIAIMAANPGNYWDYIPSGTGGRKEIPYKPLPIVEITTTAGTGSEADPWLVVTKEETNEKYGFGYDSSYPVLSVIDPDFMMSVPEKLSAFQGFDALFHAVESYINKNENPIGELFALKAVEYISAFLPNVIENPKDEEARYYMALGNTLAGMVMLCTSEHSIEHAMSAYYPNLPHGAGLIMISKAYFRYFTENHACDQRFVTLAKTMGFRDAAKPGDFIAALEKIQQKCGVSHLKMSDYGITEEDLPKFAANAREIMGHLYADDPVSISDDTVLAILKESFS